MSSTEPTHEQRMAAQETRDDQTVYALAVLMVDLHTATLLKNKNQVANCFMKSGVLLRNNPGFVERFKKEQAQIISHIKSIMPGGRMELPPAVQKQAVDDAADSLPSPGQPDGSGAI